jgi:hypothetical protein
VTPHIENPIVDRRYALSEIDPVAETQLGFRQILKG